MKIRLLLISMALYTCISLEAQIESIIWQHCLGTENGYNETHAAEKTDNGYLFGIYLFNDGPGITNFHGGPDAWMVNTDEFGNVIWERCYGGSSAESPYKIMRIDDSTYYLFNAANSSDGDVHHFQGKDFWMVRINAAGEIIWENSYGGSANGELPVDAIVMPDKGALMMGRISSSGGDVTDSYGDMDVWLCRIDSAGNIIWQKTIGNYGKDNGIKIKLTSYNTILFIGGHEYTGGMIDCPDIIENIYFDVWVVEMNLKGDFLNQWCYGGKYSDLGRDIIEIIDGFVVAATTCSNDRDVSGFHGTPGEYASDDIWVFKIDFFGNIIWQKCIGGYSWEYPVYITQTSDSGFIIIGNTNSNDGDVTGNHTPNGNGLDIWVVKLSHNGQLLWEHCFGSPLIDRFWGIHSVVKKDDYNFIIGANSIVADGDVTCDLFPDPYDLTYNAWLFEIKDCAYYAPAIPVFSSGPDTVCTSVIPVSTFNLDSAAWAWAYDWVMEPQEAGTLYLDSLAATITWNTTFEGIVTIKARSYNDCGFSAWSEPLLTFVYSGMGIGDKETGGQGEEGKRSIMEIWPNPARDIVDCRLSAVDFRGDCELVFYDVYGREVAEISIQEGQNQIQINVESYPPGVYIVTLRKGYVIVESNKFVVVK